MHINIVRYYNKNAVLYIIVCMFALANLSNGWSDFDRCLLHYLGYFYLEKIKINTFSIKMYASKVTCYNLYFIYIHLFTMKCE